MEGGRKEGRKDSKCLAKCERKWQQGIMICSVDKSFSNLDTDICKITDMLYFK
jgi:hypothetical protein